MIATFGLLLLCICCVNRAAEPPLPPGIVVAHSAVSSGIFLGSPSLLKLKDGTLLASHDLFGPETKNDTTRIFRSSEAGERWQRIAEIKGAFWSSLFDSGGSLYLLGTSRQDGSVVIRRSSDAGFTWTEPRNSQSGLLLADGKYHCAPVPVVAHNGRIWRAFEDVMGPGVWPRNFRSLVMSIPIGADPLMATNWVMSNHLEQDPGWLGGAFGGWLEGNVVVTPAGDIANVLRVDRRQLPESAALAFVSNNGQTIDFDPKTGFIDFPGGCKKFCIRRDLTGEYWALSNFIPDRQKGGNVERTRNTLALLHSQNLRRWEIWSILLSHPDRERHAFQYPDFLIDGDDMIALLRTAFDDEEGGAHSAHDANYITFHRWKNFRTRNMEGSP